MSMPWFKFHTASRHDGKLWTLTGDQHRTFTHLLSYAAEQPTRGTIQDVSELVIANETTRGNLELLRETLAALVSLRCVTCVTSDVTGVTVTFINFEKRQSSRYIGNACEPGSSRDRVRKHRQAKKLGNVTSEECNSVTPRYNQPLDRDREEEKKEYTTPHISERTQSVEAKPLPSKGESAPHQIESQPSRTPADLADVHAAEKILSSDLRTEPLAWRLAREHNLKANLAVAGWKWLRAAEKVTGPSVTDSQRKQFNYFATIAANLDDSDRVDAKRFTPAESKPEKPTIYYKARRRTPEELDRAYSRTGSIAS